jgi:hypothetical protein
VLYRWWQDDDEARAPAWLALDPNITVMAEHNLAADRQPQSCPAHHTFGREKWLKYMRKILGRNSRTGISHDDFYHLCRLSIFLRLEPRAQGNTATRPDGLQGIHAQIQQDLLQLIRITEDRWEVIRKV